MAMSNAERQRRYRLRKEKAGLVRKDSWTDRAGLLAPVAENGGWRQMSLKELELEITKLGFKGVRRNILYAELYAYAKLVEVKLKNHLEPLDDI